MVGETDSGKSTIFKLLLKSLEPKTGEIRVDGMDLARIERADWYPMIGVVPQEVMLLNDTLRRNIVLGREMDDTRLRDAAEKAAILERIEEMPDGFNSMIAEHWLKLSGGERQRIAAYRGGPPASQPCAMIASQPRSAGHLASRTVVAEAMTLQPVALTRSSNRPSGSPK
jgi:ABC-type multidrug transport system fused ATPase/permease subunit